ncbi:arginine repressor C-terminal-like domain-containing protein [Tanacetum coccineum]
MEKTMALLSSLYLGLDQRSPSKEFKMERGLRQGDPLSPFLFLLVVEALQIAILEACSKGFFKGVSLAEGGVNISLLQYADDALFFGEWSRLNAKNLILILKCFENASGLKINLSKRVGSLFAKNLALLGKWKWRFLTEKDALWRLVIKHFYGDDGGFGSSPGSNGNTGTWCDILKAVKGIEGIDSTFKNSFCLKVSNGSIISFWRDPWCGNGSRLMTIPRAISDVTDMLSLIGNLSLSPDDVDKWTWSQDNSGIFKLQTLSNNIQNLSLADCNLGVHHTWNSWIPRKSFCPSAGKNRRRTLNTA